MSSKLLYVAIGTVGLCNCGIASISNVYIAQSAVGLADGSSCNGAMAVGYLNTASNWGSGANQIGPGTTIHLCGTFTFAAGAQGLVALGSGTSSNPITIKFETGAVLQSPYFSSGGGSPSGAGGLNLYNLSYIVVDGGTPCGTTQGGVNSTNICNGTIQNTANGTSPTYTYQKNSVLVEAQGTTGVEIKNLLMQNVYVRTSTSDVTLDNTGANCLIATPATNLLVHDSVCNQSSWAFELAGAGWQFYYNQISNMDHGIALGVGGTNTTNVLIHDNHFCCTATWDDATGGDHYHHDGIHAFIGSSETDNNIYIYNNQFDGNAGAASEGMNQWIYNEGAMSNPTYIFNNVMLTSNAATGFPDEANLSTTGNFYYNNTATGGNPSAGGGTISINGTSMSAFNNIFEGSQYTMALKNPASSSTLATCGTGTGLDYNVYGTSSGVTLFGYPTGGTNTLATWQTDLAALSSQTCNEAHSVVGTVAQVNLLATGFLQLGSIAIGKGQNLTALCTGNLAPLCYDKLGNPRPTSGPWDPGAYLVVSAPTALRVLPQ